MASKSKIARKVKPSRVFGLATDYPDMTPAGYAPGTNFAAQEFSDFNKDLPGYAKLWPGSYRVETWSEGDPKKEETVYTAFKHTSGPYEGRLIPRDITVKKAGEVVSFTDVRPIATLGGAGMGLLSGKYNYASAQVHEAAEVPVGGRV